MNPSDLLFVEKYRPKKLDDCILSSSLMTTFESIIKNNDIQNMILCGTPGSGKTTVAKVLCETLNCDYLFLNASENGNIDTLRTLIRNFASTVSLTGNKKVVILDEADYLNPTSTQPALRGFIEEFANNCRFILTCNYKNKLIEPLHSRLTLIEFKILPKEKLNLAEKLLKRLEYILNNEHIKYDKKVLAELVIKYFPDIRKIITEIQRYGSSGSIDTGILVSLVDSNFDELIGFMKSKDYTNVRKWVSKNNDIDYSVLFRTLYDKCSALITPSTIPNLVILLGEYQYKMSFSVDAEICIAACLAEIMINVTFK